jgi:hypothetical protein
MYLQLEQLTVSNNGTYLLLLKTVAVCDYLVYVPQCKTQPKVKVSPCVEKAIAIERKQKEGKIARARQLNRKRMMKHQCSPQTAIVIHLSRSSVATRPDPSHRSTTTAFLNVLIREDRRP